MIFRKQTTKDYVDLLSAKSYFYDKAERFSDLEYLLAILSALSTIVVLFIPSEFENYLSLIGAFIFIITTIVLTPKKKEYTKLGALIQEKFDTKLFDIPKNDMLEDVTAELSKAFSYYSEKERKLHSEEGWYPEPSTDNRALAILLAQRANLAWDWRLRKYHTNVFRYILIFLVLGLIAVGIVFEYSLLDFLAQLFTPFLPLLWLLFENMQANHKLSQEQQAKEIEINKLACKVHRGEETLGDPYLRSLQNTIYKNRANNPVLKHKWYKKRRNQYNAEMIQVTNNLLNNC